MTIENNLAEIRAAMATLSAIHAQGALTRADILASITFVEARCDEIAAATAPGVSGNSGVSTLEILTLRDVVARAATRGAVRPRLQIVAGQGDAA